MVIARQSGYLEHRTQGIWGYEILIFYTGMLAHFPFTANKDLKNQTAHAKVLVATVMLLLSSKPARFLLEGL